MSPRRRGRGCLVRSLIVLVVLVLLAIPVWFFGLRPATHSFVQSHLDQVLADAVNRIPTELSVLPAGNLPVKQSVLNNLIVLNSSPSDPVQQLQITITSTQMRADFQVYGFACDAIGIPQIVNGKLVATVLAVDGIVSLIMSPDELATILDAHIADAVARLNHPITAVSLKDQELDLTLGSPNTPSPGNPGGQPPPIP